MTNLAKTYSGKQPNNPNQVLRDMFYKNHEDFHHSFDDGEYYLEYALYGTLPLKKTVHAEIRTATERMWGIFNRVKDKIKTLPEQDLINLGFDKRIIPFLRIDPLQTNTVTSRFDIIRTTDPTTNVESFKFIELNNDTPFLLMENYQMDDLVNESFAKPSFYPRRQAILQSSILKSLQDAATYLGKSLNECTVAIVGYDYEEDLEEYTTVSFLKNIINRLPLRCEYIHYEDIRVDMNREDILSDQTGPIDILLKPAYPYEFLINDVYDDNTKESSLGVDMLTLMEKKKVFILNPPASHILQNKGIFAYIFHLIETTQFFNPSDTEFLLKYLPYTSFTKERFPQDQTYVKKPVISREGQSVEIISPTETLKSEVNLYDDELLMYQEYLEAPTRKAMVEGVEQELFEILGVFVADNKYSGTVCRLGGRITDWYSHWIPMYEV